MDKKYLFDFSWGETSGIRKIMCDAMCSAGLTNTIPIHSFGYPNHEGDPELIKETRLLIQNLTGHLYKHVLITNGATHSLNAYISAVKKESTQSVITNKLYFSFYPGIAKNHSLDHRPMVSPITIYDDIEIIDSPSNPEGRVYATGKTYNTIFDAAYYTPTYCGEGSKNAFKCINVKPIHEALAGSFNKLTGINGLRVGWLATDSDLVYQKSLEYIEYDICGVSYPSQYVALQILKYVDLDTFYWDSKKLIDYNKEELSKIGYLFGNQEIPKIGMFALFEADKKLKNLLEKASVKVMDGSLCGDDRESVRFNLAHKNLATKEMVKAVLKADKIS